MILKGVVLVPDGYYLFSSDVWVIIAVAADDVTNVNFGFKQFVTAVGICDPL